MPRDARFSKPIAIIGTGISGMSAAWMLAKDHDITVYESAPRIGGHSNTVTTEIDGQAIDVDTGFIVYNEETYPNLTALYHHLHVPTSATNMSFAASLRGGRTEYSGESVFGLIAQKRNLLRHRFWSMLYHLQRFYRNAPRDVRDGSASSQTLGEYLHAGKYSKAFIDDHLLPLSAAIWSTAPGKMLDYPVEAFVRFHENHGLLKFTGRPVWRTVAGGSKNYIESITNEYADRIEVNARIQHVRRSPQGVEIFHKDGRRTQFDHVVFATHADQALALLDDPSEQERSLLSAFRYCDNKAYLHSDPSLMPKRKSVWASWNFLEGSDTSGALVVTYWMNKLQALKTNSDLFVTLNPDRMPQKHLCHRIETYQHPVIDSAAIRAQNDLWSLQGRNGTWFCGAYFGAGFHEDALQSGLAVAEQLGNCRRPWTVADESGRIRISPTVAADGEAALS